MRIGLFHERFIFRFGVDRVLLCLADELQMMGHQVTLIGQKFDEKWSPSKRYDIVRLPDFDPYIESDILAARWLQENWSNAFPSGKELDLAVVAGWPFFQTMGLLQSKGVLTWFQDHGIAPEDGAPEGHRRTIALLHELKRKFVGLADGIAPVSHFIARSQSYSMVRTGQPVCVVYNGVDHPLKAKIGQNDSQPLSRDAVKRIFSIGRFESGGYKQSEQVFDFARRLNSQGVRNFIVNVLGPKNLAVPEDLRDTVEPTGFLDDQAMFELMRSCAACVCFSRWEGFNLGLAESQVLGTPCLVYDEGAHAEVVAHQWLLCRSLDDFVEKISSILEGVAPESIRDVGLYQAYSDSRSWRNAAELLLDRISENGRRAKRGIVPFSRSNVLFVEVGNACRDPANSGVVRVTRQLTAKLIGEYPIVFVCWDDVLQELRFPTISELEQLSSYGGPQAGSWQPVSDSVENAAAVWDFFSSAEPFEGWLVMPEIKPPSAIQQMCRQARRWGLRAAAIFYDAIAVIRPDLVQDAKYREPHLQYMLALSECDVVIPISQASETDLQQIWKDNSKSGNSRTILLPGAFAGPRRRENHANKEAHILLCVSTIEPRKNHRKLIHAFQDYKAIHPDSNLTLVLVGNRYAGAEDLARHIEEVVASSDDIQWRGIVSDDELADLYGRSAFTVYPSEIEGFGLPILESLWHGVPCLCHNKGVMAELARDGGCMTVDVTDVEQLSKGIAALDGDRKRRDFLAAQASAREIKNWSQYAHEFIATLSLSKTIDAARVNDEPVQPEATRDSSWDWQRCLYGDSLHDGWQMSDSEKIGLLGILQASKPKLALEIGTYKGGSLSLIRQHAESVISLDIDPQVAETFSWMQNVRFLTGDSKEILPLLLSELEAQAATPEFVLIDGDHSLEGVKRDIELVLQMKPRRPCFIVMHDMANKVCRSGAMAVDWERYRYVRHVDLDFVPGRLVENGGSFDGQVWGGLGLVVLSPIQREGALDGLLSCRTMLNVLWANASIT